MGSNPTLATMTIERKIRNKERCSYRGAKQRYSVWRAEYNAKWEKINKAMVETICLDHGLNIDEWTSPEERNTWEHSLDNLKANGYNLVSKSIREHCQGNT